MSEFGIEKTSAVGEVPYRAVSCCPWFSLDLDDSKVLFKGAVAAPDKVGARFVVLQGKSCSELALMRNDFVNLTAWFHAHHHKFNGGFTAIVIFCE